MYASQQHSSLLLHLDTRATRRGRCLELCLSILIERSTDSLSNQQALTMQSAVRASAGLTCACPSASQKTRHQGRYPSCNLRVPVAVPRLAAAAPRALKDEEAELERITREANQADIWDNEFIGTGLKIALVAGVIAVAVFIGRLGEPIVENTVKSFPSPSAYEAYEESK